ncbi:MAG TPA: tRNA (adenosine(37)-N6)-threonylcarbamoyltransferase complex transferase subunit TsaD, partial [Opitutaceae bacterium]|nr:tRNA (adenosine(37)-N6)-threonylcarbamoyltransferase complex transferase subunit TsaD [Opitutaceae bacterium]
AARCARDVSGKVVGSRLGGAMILGIESSCDESALALFDPETGMRGEWLHSQVALHGAYGGVVPDLASREHLKHFVPLLRAAMSDIDPAALTAIAVTRGPGLASCLAMGVSTAKALGLAWGVPVVGGNHLRGHAWSPFIPVHKADPAGFDKALDGLLPHLGLLVSGGNTALFSLSEGGRIAMVASTLDDAAGEALDKGAKLLGLGYPGGPLIEAAAREGRRDAYDFPRGNNSRGILPSGRTRSAVEFSFSGLKTSLRYTIEKMDDAALRAAIPDLCASYEEAVVDSLAVKTARVLTGGGYRSLGVSGGVANNNRLRAALDAVAHHAGVRFLAAEPRHTGDNAAMIAFAAWMDGIAGVAPSDDGLGLTFDPSLELADM